MADREYQLALTGSGVTLGELVALWKRLREGK